MHCRPQESKSKTLQSRSRGSKRASAVHDHVRGSRLGARPLGATVTVKDRTPLFGVLSFTSTVIGVLGRAFTGITSVELVV